MKRIFLSLFLLAAIPEEAPPPGPAQPPPEPIVVSADQDVWWAFDLDDRDQDGNPLIWFPREVIFRFSEPDGEPLRWVRFVMKMVPGVNRVHQSTMLTNVPPGRYHLQVGLLNGVGGQSRYSQPPVFIEVQPSQPPQIPSEPERLRRAPSEDP